jgi:hypothetical protein
MPVLERYKSEAVANTRRNDLIRLGRSCHSVFEGEGDNAGYWCFWRS